MRLRSLNTNLFEVKRGLEPYVLKGTSTVLRGERSRETPYLLDHKSQIYDISIIVSKCSFNDFNY
jgi:hypothetical protein